MMWKRIVVPLSSLLLATPLLAGASRTTSGCNTEELALAKREFTRLRDLRREQLGGVGDGELRAASRRYVGLAEECYQAKFGAQVSTGQPIDEGGVWFNSLNPAGYNAARQPAPSPYREHHLTGTKWGAGTSFLTCCDNQDAQGPRLPGGTVTYSLMANGVDLSGDCGAGCVNTAITSLPTFESCFLQEISDTLGAWSEVADIEFLPVTDGGLPFNVGALGDIRIGAHPFDGPSGVLAHAFFPPPNGTTAAGDLHFDSAEDWSCDPNLGSIDLGIVALHELGHSLGLNHEGSDPAVMEAFYNPALTFGPLADDIIGIGEIYGGSPVGKSFFFGNVGIGTDAPGRSLDILGNADTTQIRVTNNATVGTRLLFEMINNGGAGFQLQNTNRSSTWGMFLNNAVVPGITISRIGTGVFEFLFQENGDMVIQGHLSELSDRDAKENLLPVDGSEILEKVGRLPILHWNYKSDATKEEHLGPVAQDFHELFQLGPDNRHIGPSDMSGVALAAIKELHQLVQEQKIEMEAQRAEIERLKTEVEALRKP